MMRLDPLKDQFGDLFREEDPLSRYTVARLGGPAEGMLRVKSRDDLLWAVRWIHDAEIPWFILGGGANVLASDAGFRGLVIINQARGSSIDRETGIVTAESGVNLSTLARQCMAAGLAGLEWCVSVPGTVGGAVVNNAGAHDGDMAGSLIDAEILDLTTDEISVWPVNQMRYDYRFSALKGTRGRYVVISARLQLEPGHDPSDLNAKADEFVAHRKKTQPPGASLGSMFKNPPGDYAGRLIDAAGLKGRQIGGVQISPLHGNFFVNVGGGTAADYSALIELAQASVRQQFGVDLELEIERLGDWDKLG
jgi:UDP-N-acetylmuramate dehydrogenase